MTDEPNIANVALLEDDQPIVWQIVPHGERGGVSWHATAGNGERLAWAGEGYEDRAWAIHMVQRFAKAERGDTIVDLDGTPIDVPPSPLTVALQLLLGDANFVDEGDDRGTVSLSLSDDQAAGPQFKVAASVANALRRAGLL